MNQLHVKNHYVPECYLKRWGGSEGKVWVYRTLVSHPNYPLWRRNSISAIAYQKHLYTQVISGSESDEFELWLDREFESPANEILNKATAESKLTTNDWDILIKFLATQDVRTPARLLEYLQRTHKDASEVLENTLKEVKEKLEKGNINELEVNKETFSSEIFPFKVTTHFEEGSDKGVLKAQTYVGRSTWLNSIKHLMDNTRKILHSYKWSIVKPAKGYFWPTSDNPVVKLNYYDYEKYDLKGGWGVKKGNIFFPIGPEHAMFVQIGDRSLQKNIRLSTQQTNEFIKFVTENSHRKIFSHTNNDVIPNLRRRIVDAERVSRENIEMKEWHNVNAKMEREYIK